MSLEALAKNLGEQIQHHEELLELLVAESKLPAKTLLQEFQDLQSKQGDLFEKIKMVETQRIEFIKSYAEERDGQEEYTLKEIITQCSTKRMKEKLKKYHKKLLVLLEQIQEFAQVNFIKSTARIRSIRETQQEVQKAFQRQPIYSTKGKLLRPEGASLVMKYI